VKSYKCPQCGLVDWVTNQVCRRCTAPNPHLYQSQQFSQQPNYQQVNPSFSNPPMMNATQANFAPPTSIPNFQSPPPPNAFGNNFGQAYGQTYQTPPRSQPFTHINNPELEKALKNIKNAWIAGVVSSVLGVVGGIILSAIQQDVFLFIGIFVECAIVAALSYGVYQKSRGCAIALFIIYFLDKLVALASSQGRYFPFLAILFLIYFGMGIAGTFKYHELKKSYQ
jgi:hypothetical protein